MLKNKAIFIKLNTNSLLQVGLFVAESSNLFVAENSLQGDLFVAELSTGGLLIYPVESSATTSHPVESSAILEVTLKRVLDVNELSRVLLLI